MTETATWYRRFANEDAAGVSALYAAWAAGIADDAEVLGLLERLPLQKRSPNLVFAVARLLGAPEVGWSEFREWLVDFWPAVAREAAVRTVQTNDPRRCAAVLPVLARLDGPLTLLDIGASAGLGLYPDRYAYRYDDRPQLGESAVVLHCATRGGVPVPTRLPGIAARVGVDLEPLSVADADHMRWLEALVWPEQEWRRELTRAAVGIVAADPPVMIKADAVAGLAAAVAAVPAGTRPVVITTGVLVYLPFAERMRFVDAVRALGCDWISLEGPSVLPDTASRLPGSAPAEARFVIASNERPVAFADPHGTRLHWLGADDSALDWDDGALD